MLDYLHRGASSSSSLTWHADMHIRLVAPGSEAAALPQVSLAIHNVDGALDDVDSRFSGSTPVQRSGGPPIARDLQSSPGVSQGFPVVDDEAPGQHRVLYNYKKGFTPDDAPALHMQSPGRPPYGIPGRDGGR